MTGLSKKNCRGNEIDGRPCMLIFSRFIVLLLKNTLVRSCCDWLSSALFTLLSSSALRCLVEFSSSRRPLYQRSAHVLTITTSCRSHLARPSSTAGGRRQHALSAHKSFPAIKLSRAANTRERREEQLRVRAHVQRKSRSRAHGKERRREQGWTDGVQGKDIVRGRKRLEANRVDQA